MKSDQAVRGVTAGQAARAFYLWDIPSGAIHWGGNCEPILGCAPWDMPPSLHNWIGAVHPDDRATVQAAIQNLLVDRQPLRVEYRVRRPDGRLIPVAGHAAFVTEHTIIGSVARIASSARVWEPPPPPEDSSVSDAGRTNRETARLFEMAEDLLCITGLDGYFRRVNPAFGRTLGHPDEDLLSRPYIEFVHPDDRADTLTAMKQLGQGIPLVQFRNRLRDIRGRYKWLEWTARSVPGEGVVYAVARDVSQRVELERRLKAQEARERAILNNTSVVIYVKNQQGRYEFANDQFVKLFDALGVGIVGKTDSQIFDVPLARAFQANDQQVLTTGETIQVEEYAPHPDGLHTYVSIKFPLHDEDGQVTAVAGISTDITDRIRARDAEEQFLTACHVQQRLYPVTPPSIPGFDIAWRWVPAAQLCGDYFDYVWRDDQHLVIAVGDICGHGLGPALQMVETRALLRLLLQSSDPLPEILERLNHQLYLDTPESSFVSLFVTEIDLSTRELTYAGAGHEGYLLRADGPGERLRSTGYLLGIMESCEFEPVPPTSLHPGDVLLLCTDGLNEAVSLQNEQFGTQRLIETVQNLRQRPAYDILRDLFDTITAFTGPQQVPDDRTAIILKAV